jgi:hypothetical protein
LANDREVVAGICRWLQINATMTRRKDEEKVEERESRR